MSMFDSQLKIETLTPKIMKYKTQVLKTAFLFILISSCAINDNKETSRTDLFSKIEVEQNIEIETQIVKINISQSKEIESNLNSITIYTDNPANGGEIVKVGKTLNHQTFYSEMIVPASQTTVFVEISKENNETTIKEVNIFNSSIYYNISTKSFKDKVVNESNKSNESNKFLEGLTNADNSIASLLSA